MSDSPRATGVENTSKRILIAQPGPSISGSPRVCHVTQKLIKQGFRYAELCKAFGRFAKSHLHCKYNCSVRRHIEDGVCLPAMDSWAAMSQHIDYPVGLVARCFVHTQLSDISFALTIIIIYYVHYFGRH